MVLNDDFMSVKHDVDEMKKKQKTKNTVTVPSPSSFYNSNIHSKKETQTTNESRIPFYRAPKVLNFFLLHICI